MRIIAADDEPLALKALERAIRQAGPQEELYTFTEPEEVLEYAKTHSVQVAFLDIEMGTMSGIEVAKQLKIWYPKINIVFVTGYNDYMADAIRLRMSGYVEKPVTKEKIQIELEDLKYPQIEQITTGEKKLTARCFGTFDVFVNGQHLEFGKEKAKEMLAYLIDRRGSAVTTGELRSVLWQNAENDNNTRAYLSKAKKDLKDVLKKAGVEDIFLEFRRKYAIDPTKIKCDYYDYLDDNPDGVRAYNGEYMMPYDWGEIQNVILADQSGVRSGGRTHHNK